MSERRIDGERRMGERVTRVEDQIEDHDRTLQAIAPVAVHLAEMNVKYSSIEKTTERIEHRLDDLHPRLRKLEYAVLLLGIAALSPKLGGPSVSNVVSAVLNHI